MNLVVYFLALIASTVWAVVISLFIALWIALGKDGFGKVNIIAVVLLLGLTLLLCGVVFKEGVIFTKINTGEMSFGLALELSIIMPLSWLPLVSDYTRFARKRSGLFGNIFRLFYRKFFDVHRRVVYRVVCQRCKCWKYDDGIAIRFCRSWHCLALNGYNNLFGRVFCKESV